MCYLASQRDRPYCLWSLGVNATPVGESVVSRRGGCCAEVHGSGDVGGLGSVAGG
jgi:hypothetical protein